MRGIPLGFTLMATLLVAATSTAQPPDRPADKLGRQGAADLGFTLTNGNSDTTSLALGFNLLNRRPEDKWTFSMSYLRATGEGRETANKADGLAEYDHFLSKRLFLFGKLLAGFNKPAGLDRRLAPGAGVGYVVLDQKAVSVALNGAGSYIRDTFSDHTTDDGFFVSLGEQMSYTLNDRAALLQLFTYSPRAKDFGDYLIHAEAALTALVTKTLGLKVSVVDDYDATPFVDPSGLARARNDTSLVTALTFKF